jgi:RNA polymerase sigma-70 factor (ECF subfamily)
LAEVETTADAELVHAARRGDRAAFGRLVARYAARAVRVAEILLGNRADAEDAAQDAFVRALERLDSLRRPEAFGSWLLRLVTTVSLNARRARGRRREEEIAEDPVLDAPDAAASAYHAELRIALGRALDSLSGERQLAVVLCLVDGMNATEAGAIMGIPAGTVRSHLHHARIRLQRELAPFGARDPGADVRDTRDAMVDERGG